MSVLGDTIRDLEAAGAAHKRVMVSYSGGKDSLAVLDLCMRHFEFVECFFMYLIPGLSCVEIPLQFARETFGVTIHQYPHWLGAKLLRAGVYCDAHWTLDNLPDWKLKDIYGLVAADHSATLIATGAKISDGRWRRQQLAHVEKYGKGGDAGPVILNPIKGWSTFDVISYLEARKIPLPPSDGTKASGVDLSAPSLLWLARDFPEDFKKICAVFPYAEAVIWRKKWYGIG